MSQGRLGTAASSPFNPIGLNGKRNINHFRKTPMNNPPLSSSVSALTAPSSLSPILARIKAAHHRCHRGSVEAVTAAVECGLLLIELRKMLKHGEWNRTLKSIDFPQKTAWNYMEIAKRSDGKVLKDGIYFCNLLREPDFGLLPELNGGGRRLGKAELERRRKADQMLFHFERAMPGFDEVLRFNGGVNPLLSAPEEAVKKMETAATRVLLWAREARQGEIEV